MTQPDLSKIFDKHVELSNKCRVSGLYDIWICGLDNEWLHYADLESEAKQKLQQVCVEHGEQVHNTQWDFEREDFIQYVLPIVDKKAWEKARVVELGFGQYVEA